MGEGSFEFNEPRASSSTEQNINKPGIVSSTEECEVLRPSAIISIVGLKDYNIAKQTIHYIQVNHVIEKPKTKNTEAEENLKKAEFDFMIDMKTLLHKSSVVPKSLQFKTCVRNKQKGIAREEF